MKKTYKKSYKKPYKKSSKKPYKRSSKKPYKRRYQKSFKKKKFGKGLSPVEIGDSFVSPRGKYPHIPQTQIEVIDGKEKAELFDVLTMTATQSLNQSESDKATNNLIDGYLQKQYIKQKDQKKPLIIFKILENQDIFAIKNNKSNKFNILSIIMEIIKDKIPLLLQRFLAKTESIALKNEFLNDSILQPIFINLKKKHEKLKGENPPSEE
jgi:hypothetical protein